MTDVRFIIWNCIALLVALMMALTSIIILSDAPHNSMEFSTLPKNVQNEISLFAESRYVNNCILTELLSFKFRFHEFEAKQALELEPYRTTHLMLHIMPEICTDGNKARQSGPWPEYEEQYYCASTPVANWCDGYRNMHKATESVISMPGGYELVASFSCLRIMREIFYDCKKYSILFTATKNSIYIEMSIKFQLGFDE